MTKNIVSTMIAQHRVLQKNIEDVVGILDNKNPSANKLVNLLKTFKKNLIEHLKLENDTFYVKLLKKIKKGSNDTADTEQFIEEMKEIEKVVTAFLEKYKKAARVKEDIKNFKLGITGIAEALTLRIEEEESGVYNYWKLL